MSVEEDLDFALGRLEQRVRVVCERKTSKLMAHDVKEIPRKIKKPFSKGLIYLSIFALLFIAVLGWYYFDQIMGVILINLRNFKEYWIDLSKWF